MSDKSDPKSQKPEPDVKTDDQKKPKDLLSSSSSTVQKRLAKTSETSGPTDISLTTQQPVPSDNISVQTANTTGSDSDLSVLTNDFKYFALWRKGLKDNKRLATQLSELVDKLEDKCKESELLSASNEEFKTEVAKLKTICSDLEQRVDNLTKSCDNFVEENVVLKESVEKERQNFLKANEELREMQTVVDKRFDNFRQNVSVLKQCLTDEQQRSIRIEEELQKYKQQESQQIDGNLIE